MWSVCSCNGNCEATAPQRRRPPPLPALAARPPCWRRLSRRGRRKGRRRVPTGLAAGAGAAGGAALQAWRTRSAASVAAAWCSSGGRVPRPGSTGGLAPGSWRTVSLGVLPPTAGLPCAPTVWQHAGLLWSPSFVMQPRSSLRACTALHACACPGPVGQPQVSVQAAQHPPNLKA